MTKIPNGPKPILNRLCVSTGCLRHCRKSSEAGVFLRKLQEHAIVKAFLSTGEMALEAGNLRCTIRTACAAKPVLRHDKLDEYRLSSGYDINPINPS